VLLVAVLAGCPGERGGGRAGAGTAATDAAGLAWERSLSAALERAGREDKIVMMDFYTDWCRWCDKLDRTTLADARVRQALAAVVPVKLNAESEGRGEAERYRVDGYPTLVFVDAKGREVGRIPGYLPPAEFLQEVTDIVGRA